MNEPAIFLYIDVLQQELDRKARDIGEARQELSRIQDLKGDIEQSLRRDTVPPSVEQAEILFDFVRYWNRRNVEAKRLGEEEFRQKTRIYDMEVEILRLWRKQETLRRLVIRQQQRRHARQAFRLGREQQELIMAGQPPPER